MVQKNILKQILVKQDLFFIVNVDPKNRLENFIVQKLY